MRVKARAPINIALLKYWGKQDEVKVIPYNDSLSLSLDAFYTETVVETSNGFSYTLNGKAVTGEALLKLEMFIKQFTSNPLNIKVASINTGPTAAGLASSASAFASLGKALDAYYDCRLDINALAEKVRKGSGSACRSLLGNFVHWKQNGELLEYANPFDDLRMVIALINTDKKEISSRDAMKHTVKTSPLYTSWVRHANTSKKQFIEAIQQEDFKALGELTETSFLAMHGSMLAANPPVRYIENESQRVLTLIHRLRKENVFVYATMDAGPNVKILVKKNDIKQLNNTLNNAGFTNLVISSIDTQGAVIIHEN